MGYVWMALTLWAAWWRWHTEEELFERFWVVEGTTMDGRVRVLQLRAAGSAPAS